jgi:hypothetical protein
MLKDSITLTGRLLIQKFEADGTLVYQTEVPNLVVTAGKEFMASRMVGTAYDAMGYMSIGDDSSVSALTNTSLVNEVQRVACSATTPAGTNTTFTALFPADSSTHSIREAGIFNKGASSVVTFDSVNAVDSSTHVITYASHGFNTGDKVTYTNGGGTSVVGLTTGNSYYVIKTGTNTFKLALSYTDATAGSPVAIPITDGVGTNHKLAYGTMLARTTFPVITKTGTQAISISWVVSVG